ncbi:MAG: ABC-F family ATP-binding cassette domain-containing protein [Candidatus Babeliaceae bacterium]
MIQLRNVTLDLGNKRVFEDITCVIQQNDRVGLIGRNGAGKSTLLKVIAGLIKPTSGHISIEKDTRIAYLPQEEVLTSTLLVFDEAFSAFSHIFETEKEINAIEEAITNGTCTDELLEKYAELQAMAQTFNKFDAIKQTNEVLAGLGFTATMLQKSVNELSTGWKMRLALAKLLLMDADLYLFDEPTNHLDMMTQQWFLQKLQGMQQGFLLVSHDRAYLDKACTCILEIERGHGTYYRGNLQAYLDEKQQQIDIARSTRARQDREIAQKTKIIDRFRAGTRSQQAQNLMKQIERIELVEVEPPLPTINFYFPAPQRPGSIVLKFNNLAYEFNGITIFHSITGEIQRGERVALIAANGVGKTTLLNCITGRYIPTKGTVTFGHNVHSAFFEQDQARALDAEKTIFEEVLDACSRVTELEVRKTLGSFQFSGDDIYKKIKGLSGGEKNRVAMVKVLLQRANFLILDEPTNHLDLYAKDVLCQALAAYEGTMLFVSHDLDFVSKLATHIIELTPTQAYTYAGTYENFVLQKQYQQSLTTTKVTTKSSAFQPNKSPATKDAQSQLNTLRKQVTELERMITRLEQDEKQITESLGTHSYGSDEYNKALKQLTEIQKSLEQKYKEWETAQQKLSLP